MTNRIFVYGSLRKGRGAHAYLRDTKFVEKTCVPGFDMWAISWFPGIKENPDNKEGIVGEIYTHPADEKKARDLVQNLDYYEGYFPGRDEKKSLFVRKEIEVKGEPTYVYVYNGEPQERPACFKVDDGDWYTANV